MRVVVTEHYGNNCKLIHWCGKTFSGQTFTLFQRLLCLYTRFVASRGCLGILDLWQYTRPFQPLSRVIILEASQVVATEGLLWVSSCPQKRGTEPEKWQVPNPLLLILFLPLDQAQLMALTTEWTNKAKFNCMFETWGWAQLDLQLSWEQHCSQSHSLHRLATRVGLLSLCQELLYLTIHLPTCHAATKPVRHNYWACALDPVSHNYWAHVPQLLKPVCLEPVLHSKRSHHNEKPAHHNEE